jgi:hypothetical protein
VRGVLHHLHVLHAPLGKHLVCAGTVLEVGFIAVKHILRGDPLGRLQEVVEELLHILPGHGGPGPLDGVALPEHEGGVPLKEERDPPSLGQVVRKPGDHASLVQVRLHKMAEVPACKGKPPVGKNLDFLQELELLLLCQDRRPTYVRPMSVRHVVQNRRFGNAEPLAGLAQAQTLLSVGLDGLLNVLR